MNILNVPDPLIPDNEEWEGFFEFGKPWTTINESDPEQNPWRINNNPDLAPFDSEVSYVEHNTLAPSLKKDINPNVKLLNVC